ncbi:hypothetical protein [Kitasatospora sp. NBC_01302]|uniref:hypothetical protein n=1 Tax=Kitasatospora sp. NBC_01302 TaxID=2903575 RepID=UPI002E139C78|nr:hypothetical protein OG294_00250 [Kitasatospora sp. NBC_01302]
MNRADLAAKYTFLETADLDHLDGKSDSEQDAYAFARLQAMLSGPQYCLGPGGAHMPIGTLRLDDLAGKTYVYRCGPGLLGTVDWINTGEKAGQGPYRGVRDPASDFTIHKGDNGNFSRVKAALTGQVGWDGQYQKLTVTFEAIPQYWNELLWEEEGHKGIVTALSITLSITGPGGSVVTSEPITHNQSGTGDPIKFTITREFKNLPVGDYRLAVSGQKTGGRRTRVNSKETGRVAIQEHVVSCTIGRE